MKKGAADLAFATGDAAQKLAQMVGQKIKNVVEEQVKVAGALEELNKTAEERMEETFQEIKDSTDRIRKLTENNNLGVGDIHLTPEDIEKRLQELRNKGEIPPEIDSKLPKHDKKKKQVEPKKIEKSKIKNLAEEMKKDLFGQDDILEAIEDQIKVSAAGLRIEDNKPLGAFFCAGPSGVGKTEVWKIISRVLEIPLLRYNMSEYTTEADIKKFIGSPAGYVGYEDGGLLTNAVMENPTAIVLLDEIEKADPEIYKILLQTLDEAELSDNKGNIVSFRNVIVVCTSNLAAEVEYINGISKADKDEYRMEKIKQTIPPEIINRFDSFFHFNPIDKEVYSKISKKFMKMIQDKMKAQQNIEMVYSQEVYDFIIDKSYDRALGGRPAKRFIEKVIMKAIIDTIVYGEISNVPEYINIDLDKENGKLIFKDKENKVFLTLEETQKLVEIYEKGKFTKEEKEENLPATTIAEDYKEGGGIEKKLDKVRSKKTDRIKPAH